MQRFFESVFQEAQDTANRIAQVFEDGLAVIDDASSQQQSPKESWSEMNLDDVEEDFLSETNPLQDITDNVLSDIMKNQVRPESFWEHVQAFTSAIDWTEPLIVGLLGFHIFVFGSTVWVIRCKNSIIQLIFMSTLTIVCRCGSRINAYGSQHWEEWGITQNYFDAQGFFIAVMLCVPLLLNSLLLLVCMLREAAYLLFQVTSMKMKHKAKQLTKQQKQPSSSSSSTHKTKKSASKSKTRGKQD
eukprot:CAMPEP_0197825216 /NCGR_PEP_ID=MMETSP1437-20131217/2331_1 /TAXON_ID=49252 ORGANISM="Eucampia antarctica, Strain CCMP1452" /NCGR_SAMPLE_ID=MMETSP1437 /ASSEMBLY_ACC=CAM_ASM_001096 /LENGTH=243 /DNA_ID=CAMNT_0043425117 /DNA_START=29 /DNA_END=760 /DNA_ORIENTATION=+